MNATAAGSSSIQRDEILQWTLPRLRRVLGDRVLQPHDLHAVHQRAEQIHGGPLPHPSAVWPDEPTFAADVIRWTARVPLPVLTTEDLGGVEALIRGNHDDAQLTRFERLRNIVRAAAHVPSQQATTVSEAYQRRIALNTIALSLATGDHERRNLIAKSLRDSYETGRASTSRLYRAGAAGAGLVPNRSLFPRGAAGEALAFDLMATTVSLALEASMLRGDLDPATQAISLPSGPDGKWEEWTPVSLVTQAQMHSLLEPGELADPGHSELLDRRALPTHGGSLSTDEFEALMRAGHDEIILSAHESFVGPHAARLIDLHLAPRAKEIHALWETPLEFFEALVSHTAASFWLDGPGFELAAANPAFEALPAPNAPGRSDAVREICRTLGGLDLGEPPNSEAFNSWLPLAVYATTPRPLDPLGGPNGTQLLVRRVLEDALVNRRIMTVPVIRAGAEVCRLRPRQALFGDLPEAQDLAAELFAVVFAIGIEGLLLRGLFDPMCTRHQLPTGASGSDARWGLPSLTAYTLMNFFYEDDAS